MIYFTSNTRIYMEKMQSHLNNIPHYKVISLHCIVHYIKASFLFPISSVCVCGYGKHVYAPNSPLKYHYFEKWYDKVHQTPKILFSYTYIHYIVLCFVFCAIGHRTRETKFCTKFRFGMCVCVFV